MDCFLNSNLFNVENILDFRNFLSSKVEINYNNSFNILENFVGVLFGKILDGMQKLNQNFNQNTRSIPSDAEHRL